MVKSNCWYNVAAYVVQVLVRCVWCAGRE